jgi:hypothetical protein
VLAYIGLGWQLGIPAGQDADATLLGHVRDEGMARTDPSVRLYRTRARQDFHTDGSDVVGLLCLQGAMIGGESRIASSLAVYNEILTRRPDILEVLYEPMYWDRNDEQSPGEAPYFALPVFNDVAGASRMFYISWYICDAQRHPQVPRLTDPQREALDLIESIANDPAFHLGYEDCRIFARDRLAQELMDHPLAMTNVRTTSVIPTPSLLLGTTGGTRRHSRPKRARSADWTVLGEPTWENNPKFRRRPPRQRQCGSGIGAPKLAIKP